MKISATTSGCLGPFIDFMGLMSVLPLMPYFVENAGASNIWVGAILSAQYGAVVIGSQLFGYMSDLHGPRKTMILTLAVDCGLFLLTGLVKSVWAMLIVRFFAG